MSLAIRRSSKYGYFSSAPSSSSWTTPRLRKADATQRQRFSTSSSRLKNHYDALGISRNATKMEIKSNYFRLSKQYHPDVASEPGSKEIFFEVSEAYNVLNNDRRRRAYDRELDRQAEASRPAAPVSGHRPGPAFSSSSNMTYGSGRWAYETYETRRRGATHAWENTRRYRPTASHSGATAGRSHAHPHAQASGSPPSGGQRQQHQPSPQQRRSAREERAEEERRESDRIHNESGVGRFFRVLGVVMLVVSAGGFLSGRGVV